MAAYYPISFIASQFEDYANYWLKGYDQGTTTPLAMATDATGGTTAAKAEINTNGFIKTAGGTIFIPHYNAAYDLYLFPTSAEADANDTTNAVKVADNINLELPLTGLVKERDTVAAMDTDANLKVGDVVLTLGYNSKGDGGGNHYEIVAAATGTDDGGSYIDLSGSGLQAKGLFPWGRVSIRQFGAVPDVDSSTAIQAAIDFSNVVYCGDEDDVFLAAGLTVSSDTTFIGDYPTIKKPASTAGNLISSTTNGVTIKFSGIKFDADYTNQTALQTVYIARITGLQATVTFGDCYFLNQEYCSIRVDGSTTLSQKSFITISDCFFIDGQEGTSSYDPRYVQIGGSVVVKINDNTFDRNLTPTGSGICGIATVLITTPNATALTITDNHFIDVGRCDVNRLGAIELYAGAGGVIVTGNRILRAYGRGISVKANVKSSVLAGNIVDATVSDGVNDAHGITMSGTADDTTIGEGFVCSANIVRDADGIGFNLIGDALAPGFLVNATITNNQCFRSSLNNYNIQGYTNVLCNDNLSYQSADTAFAFSDILGLLTFNDNIIDGVTANHGVTAFDDNFTATTLIATGNTFKDIDTYGIVTTTDASNGLAGFTISDNRFDTVGSSCIRFGGQTMFSRASNNTFDSCSTPFTSLVASSKTSFSKNMTELTLAPVLTISSGSISVWNETHRVATEGGAGTDDLDTVSGGYEGRVLVLTASSSSNDVVLKDSTGNLSLNGDFTLTHSNDTITLLYSGGTWKEVCRSDNSV